MTILLDQRGEYPNKPFKSLASKAWNEFFKIAKDETDLAYWVIQADSAMIGLTARTSSENECGPDWESPTLIGVLVDGIIESFGEKSTFSNEVLRNDFQRWAVEGILASFQSAGVIKKFKSFTSGSKSFSVVISPTDAGLVEDDLTIIWTNDKTISKSEIRARQKKGRSRSRKRAVKKRSPRTKAPTKRRRSE